MHRRRSRRRGHEGRLHDRLGVVPDGAGAKQTTSLSSWQLAIARLRSRSESPESASARWGDNLWGQVLGSTGPPRGPSLPLEHGVRQQPERQNRAGRYLFLICTRARAGRPDATAARMPPARAVLLPETRRRHAPGSPTTLCEGADLLLPTLAPTPRHTYHTGHTGR